jgi:hypothetical protein
MELRSKRLYAMTVSELRAQAEEYERAGNVMWAQLCREQIGLNRRVYEAFLRSCKCPTT